MLTDFCELTIILKPDLPVFRALLYKYNAAYFVSAVDEMSYYWNC